MASNAKNSDLMKVFGGDTGKWPRVFAAVAKHLYSRFHHLFDSFCPGLVERFPMYAKAVQDYLTSRGITFSSSFVGVRTALMIDCNLIKTNRPGGGPSAAGANAPRYNRNIQRAFYNGWGRNHGLKSEAAGSPDGLIGWLSKPKSLRHSDPWMLNTSRFNEKLGEAQEDNDDDEQYTAYGDGAYWTMSHVRSKKGPLAVDEAMSSVRELIEHIFGETDSYFPYMADKKNLKLMSTQPLMELYLSVQLLRNCYTCLYHDKTSNRLNCPPPSLETYLAW